MSKRARGATRPGQRRPTQRLGARPGERTPSTEPLAAETLTDTGVSPSLPPVAMTPTREPSRARSRPSGAFAASAAQEYAYVATDVRRIVVMGGALFAAMFVLYFLIEVSHILRI